MAIVALLATASGINQVDSPSGHRRPLSPPKPIAARLVELIADLAPGTRVTAFDGSAAGPVEADWTIEIVRPEALVRMLRAPRGLGLARAWIVGDIELGGDLLRLTASERQLYEPRLILTALQAALRSVHLTGISAFRHAGPTAIEHRRLLPGRHSVARDLEETAFHYDLSADFYEILLGPSLTYSSAMFGATATSLEDAQDAKHDAVCEKLELTASSRLLDIGCGWGSLLLAAQTQCGAAGVGLTASRSQAEAARARVAFAGLDDIDVRYGDYRDLLPVSQVTAVASIGMYEHVGARRSVGFFKLVRSNLVPGARYLNQAIVRRPQTARRARTNAFTQRYIFPNGQLLSLNHQLRDLEQAGFRVLDVEAFGDSYAETTLHWYRNLMDRWDECVALEGEQRARAWQMYLLGAHWRFKRHNIDVVQVLAEAV
jgi:cyclopropane-fatty-acyl-phospholipid synthase